MQCDNVSRESGQLVSTYCCRAYSTIAIVGWKKTQGRNLQFSANFRQMGLWVLEILILRVNV